MRHRHSRPVARAILVMATAFFWTSLGVTPLAQTNTGEVAGIVRDLSGSALVALP
jgi:hypothetical protein